MASIGIGVRNELAASTAGPMLYGQVRSSMASTALRLPRFSGWKNVVLVAARREVTLIFNALSDFHGRPIITLAIVLITEGHTIMD
jgi:hypothetical protein